jgi:hypothetical protein
VLWPPACFTNPCPCFNISATILIKQSFDNFDTSTWKKHKNIYISIKKKNDLCRKKKCFEIKKYIVKELRIGHKKEAKKKQQPETRHTHAHKHTQRNILTITVL